MKLKTKVDVMFANEKSGHDIAHLERVMRLALHIQKEEGGDRLIIGISAYLHDIHRLLENREHKFFSPKMSLPIVKDLLKSVDFPDREISKVLHCIEFHEEYDFTPQGKTVSDLETLILQDADNLDAMGAIGIARAFMYAGHHGAVMWNPEVPLNPEALFEDAKSLDDASTIHHFYHNILKLCDNMNTSTAKSIAKDRQEFTQEYIERFFTEWDFI